MKKKDWELLPAPEPWASVEEWLNKLHNGMAAILIVGAAIIPFAFWPMIIFSAAMVIGASILLWSTHTKSTDGKETWIIYLPVSTELYHDIDSELESHLKKSGYGFMKGKADSAYIDKETQEPLGRLLYVYNVPHGITADAAKERMDIGLTVRFYFRLAGKTQTPFFKFMLERVNILNYRDALVLQADIVQVLKSLDYESINGH